MKKIIESILIVIAILLLHACDSTLDNYGLTDESNKVSVSFYLSSGSLSTATLSSVTDDAYRAYDNQLDLTQLDVWFFVEGQDPLAVNNLVLIQDQTNLGVYHVIGNIELPAECQNTSKQYRIEVFANCGTSINYATRNTLNYQYQNGLFKPGSTKTIPMWGVSTQSLTLRAGERTQLNDIFIVRSLAKVKVGLSAELKAKGYAIESLSLNRCNSQGYCLPSNSSIDNLDAQTIIGIHVPTNLNVLQNVSLFSGGDDFYIYLPEYISTSDLLYSVRLKNTLQSITKTDYTFKFNYSNITDAEKVLRNNYYTYEIVKVQDDEINVVFDVLGWVLKRTEIWWNPDEANYSFTPQSATNTINATNSYLDFTFKFDLNNGEQVLHGARWTATLSNGLDFELVEENLGTGKKSVFHGLARTEPYTIRVRAKKAAATQTRTTSLYITVDGIKLKIGASKEDHIIITQLAK